jgi:hypothetical protein
MAQSNERLAAVTVSVESTTTVFNAIRLLLEPAMTDISGWMPQPKFHVLWEQVTFTC